MNSPFQRGNFSTGSTTGDMFWIIRGNVFFLESAEDRFQHMV